MKEFLQAIWEMIVLFFGKEPINPTPNPDDGVEGGDIVIPPPSQDLHPLRIGKAIVNLEARRDPDGHLMIYLLPRNDGGGSKEIAGLNDKYHPEILATLERMEPSLRENAAAKYIEEYTLKGTGLKLSDSIRQGTLFFVLDTAFNRGPSGCAWIVQDALRAAGYSVIRDKQWGPKTRAALFKADVANVQIVKKLRESREKYEREVVGYRANFWKGLESRWNKAFNIANRWNDEAAATPAPVSPTEPVLKEPKWLTLARAEIGQKEIKGSKHNPRVVAYWNDAELTFKDDETPWCAGFVGAMLERAGIDGTGSGMARSYERWGKRLQIPTLGCVVTFWRGSRSSGSGHVGFYVGNDSSGNLMILGGNQSDAVNVRPFSRSRVTGYWWPNDTSLQPYKNQPLLASDGKVSTNES